MATAVAAAVVAVAVDGMVTRLDIATSFSMEVAQTTIEEKMVWTVCGVLTRLDLVTWWVVVLTAEATTVEIRVAAIRITNLKWPILIQNRMNE